MARTAARLETWQVLLTISLVLLPLAVHGRHSPLRHHHRNQSSVNKEAFRTRMVLSDDSAERDHLIGAGPGARHLVGSTKHHRLHKHLHRDGREEELTAGGAGPDQPGSPLSDGVITVEFHSPAPDATPVWPKAPKPQRQKGGAPTAWTLSDFYDYLSPDDDLSALGMTPEPEPTPSPPADMEDENPLLSGSPARPEVAGADGQSSPAIPREDKGPGLSFGGAMGTDGCRLGLVRSGPGVCVPQCDIQPNFCLNGGVCTVVAGVGAFCRCNVQDYIWNKGTRCDWAVTEFQVMCIVVGVSSLVLLLLFMIIVFFAKRLHRLKNENKRLRRRSKYRPQSSEPQTDGLSVSTTADSSQPNVRKLCDTPPPASQAHTHNLAYYDNIICQRPPSVSYTWEGKPRHSCNHFQDEPQKQEDTAKTPQPKEDDSMNILNSHSPKYENNRPASVVQDHGQTSNNMEESAEAGVTIGLEVLLPKEAKLQPETSAPLQYDVFLYKVANNGDSSFANAHQIPKSPKSPRANRSAAGRPGSRREPLSLRHSSSGRRSPGRHPSPGRHSAPGGYSPPPCRIPAHQSPSHYQYLQRSSSSPPPLLRSPRGRSQIPHSPCCGTERARQSRHIRPSPSSPHIAQYPPSPSGLKCSPVSTRSLPPLS